MDENGLREREVLGLARRRGLVRRRHRWYSLRRRIGLGVGYNKRGLQQGRGGRLADRPGTVFCADAKLELDDFSALQVEVPLQVVAHLKLHPIDPPEALKANIFCVTLTHDWLEYVVSQIAVEATMKVEMKRRCTDEPRALGKRNFNRWSRRRAAKATIEGSCVR